MKTAVIYARYSCEKQTEQSIEGQLRVCEEYAKKNDFQYFLTSAATGKGIKDLFMYISKTLMVKFPQEIGESQSTLVDNSNQNSKCGC